MAQFIGDERVSGENFQYTFPSIDAYLAAKNGTSPLGYTSMQQTRRPARSPLLLHPQASRPVRGTCGAAVSAAGRSASAPLRAYAATNG